MTWLELIRSSLRMIGELGPGRTIDATSTPAIDAQLVLNSMLDQMNADRLSVFTITQATYALSPSKSSYTIGPSGADITATRPQKIETANLIFPGTQLRRKLEVLNDAQWASIKLVTLAGDVPQYLYNDGGFPTSTLYFWPTPGAGYSLELWTWQLLTQVSNLATTISLPPGYQDWIRTKLAVRLAAEWSKPLRPDVVELARQAEVAVQRANQPLPTMACDGAVLKTDRGGAFNIYTGDYGV